MDYLIGKILYQQLSDPSWNKTPSSAMFAIRALCEVDYKEKAKDSMDFLRSIYGISGDKVVVNIDFLSTVEDFKNIKKAMMKQDENENLYREKGEEIDEKTFHSNWVKGLILCAEAY